MDHGALYLKDMKTFCKLLRLWNAETKPKDYNQICLKIGPLWAFISNFYRAKQVVVLVTPELLADNSAWTSIIDTYFTVWMTSCSANFGLGSYQQIYLLTYLVESKPVNQEVSRRTVLLTKQVSLSFFALVCTSSSYSWNPIWGRWNSTLKGYSNGLE